MYKNKKMLSAIAAVSILSSGAIAFDLLPNGNIISVMDGLKIPLIDIDEDEVTIKVVEDRNAIEYDPKVDQNGAQKTTLKLTGATYLGGVEANKSLELSPDGKGDALIYPAFRAGDGWSSEIIVRNTNDRAIVAKAVLYTAEDSNEILDFNIYLSAHDAFRFNISEEGNITTRDGSYVKGVDPTYETDKVEFVNHEKQDFTIGQLPENISSGYIVIYGMVEARSEGYHGNHKKLYQDYRIALDLCRDSDGDINNNKNRNGVPITQWRRAFVENSVIHGTFVLPSGVGAPNVDANCTDVMRNKKANKDQNETIKLRENEFPLDGFKSPDQNALFGSVRIQHGGDNRDLLLPATALDNFTDDSVDQIMLWATGEWASLQDRRLKDNNNSYSTYDTDGIREDAKTFLVKKAYYVFNKDEDNIERNTMLVTQPLKRPLVQMGDPDGYWDNVGSDSKVWGDFKLHYSLYDDNETEYAKEAGLVHIVSPYTSDPEAGYVNELQALRDLEEDTNLIKDEYFNHKTNGYAEIEFYGNTNGIPAIITQMTSSQVGGEAQLNWVYSTVVK